MNLIIKTDFPANSLLVNSIKYDFVDSYGILINTKKEIDSTTAGKAFFSGSPRWVGALFNFRNKIVRVLGLKVSAPSVNPEKALANFKCEAGEQLGLFKVFAKNQHEVILGEDDKHLDFRISIYLKKTVDQKQQMILSTTVIFNNWFGKLYFLPVKPFHKLVVPAMMKKMIKQLEKCN